MKMWFAHQGLVESWGKNETKMQRNFSIPKPRNKDAAKM